MDHDRPLLIATEDAGSVFVAENADALREGFRFQEPPLDIVRVLTSKQGLERVCRDHGVPTPAVSFPRSRADVAAFAEQATFPVVLKGIKPWLLYERTGLRLVVARDRERLLAHYDRLEDPSEPNVMLQEYIPGDSKSVWMFNGYFGEGSERLFGLTGRKVRQYPLRGGVTSLGECVRNEEVERVTVRLMQALGYRGILDIGYRFDARDGTYKLLDANPRLGVTFRLFVDSVGMDVARALYLDLTGQPVVAGSPREGRRWVVENLDLASAARHIGARRLGLLGWLRSYRGVEERAWLVKDDPVPFLGMCTALLTAAVRRVLRFRGGRLEIQSLRPSVSETGVKRFEAVKKAVGTKT